MIPPKFPHPTPLVKFKGPAFGDDLNAYSLVTSEQEKKNSIWVIFLSLIIA